MLAVNVIITLIFSLTALLSWASVTEAAAEEELEQLIRRLGGDDLLPPAAPKLLGKQRALAADGNGCTVGSAFHVVSSDYPKSTGCYFKTLLEKTSDGLFFTQTGVEPSETGDGLGQAVMIGAMKRVRSSSHSYSSDTLVYSSSSSSSFSSGPPSRFGILWRHFYVPERSETTPNATLSEVLASVPYGCNGYSPFLGMSHPTDVLQWFCGEQPFARIEIINDDGSSDSSDSSGSFSGSEPRPAFAIVSKEAFSLVCEAGCDVTATVTNYSDATDASNNKEGQERLQIMRVEEALDDYGTSNAAAVVCASDCLSPLRVVYVVAGAAAAAAAAATMII